MMAVCRPFPVLVALAAILAAAPEALAWRAPVLPAGLAGLAAGAVTITDDTDEGIACFKIVTDSATYYYDKAGAGFTSMLDKDGTDWINFHPTGGSAGSYRGIPNMGLNAFGHPGYTGATSTTPDQKGVPLSKATINSTKGSWSVTWEFFSTYAKMTVHSVGANYWYLYEGTPGGAVGSDDVCWRSNGQWSSCATSWNGDIANTSGVATGAEWVYFADGVKDRSLFLIHDDDSLNEEYWMMEGNMTVFGFGRSGTTGLLSQVPATLVIGFAESRDYNTVKGVIGSAWGPPDKVATPSINPSGGTFSSPVSVTISCATSGATIRYTTDGSTPSSSHGTVYAGAFTVSASSTVKAIAYKSGMTDSDVASASFTIVSLRDPENPSGTVSGLNVSYYELSSPSALPNFGSLTAYKTDTVAEINYPSTDGNFATSGRADNVGAVFTGYVQAPSDGVYTFYTTSDDGSALYIGAQKVVDNDGTHGMQERSGSIGLRAGKHALRVEFFEAGGGAGLVVSWEGPGVGKQTIPASALFRSGSSPVPTTVVVTPASATIDPGGTQLFSAEVRDQNGQPMSATVSWSVSGGGTVSPSTGTSTTFRSDGSTGTFTVTATAGAAQGSAAVTVYSGPWVSISSPAAGEVWYVGTTRRIRWTASGVSVVTLTWSADGGSYWESIATSVRDTDAGWQDYPWVVPDSPSTQCLVRVSGYMGECSAQSGLFEIRAVTDTDSDGMDDGWEIEHFGDLGRDGTADADGDGLTDYEEFMRGTDPNVANGSGGSGAGGFSCSPAGRAGEGSGTLLALGLLVALAAARNRSATLRPRPAPSSGRG